MSKTRDPMQVNPEKIPTDLCEQVDRKPYRTPMCRSLGDVRLVTLKSGTRVDASVNNPTRR
jgi:hypothetical protein